ncbi:CNPY2 protein, partial [Leiothrix lutea]|nr:CNPY2 protein [Leiothrix lutea]
ACRALVDELEWEIAQVDPRKTIQMGSFRINPDGSQSVVEVPYARSEAHLTELLERVCERMKEYGERADPATQRKSYVRVISRDGTKMDLSGVKFDGDVTSSLKFACESIAEEYEDELIEFLSHEAENVKDRLCSKRTEQGTEQGQARLPGLSRPGAAMTLLAAGSRAAARLRGPKNAPCVLFAARHASAATNLKDVLATMIPKEQAKIKSFRQQHGSTAIGQITVDM